MSAQQTNITRRRFIKQVASTGIALPMLLPRLSLAQSPNSKLHHASIGVGGMGWSDLNSIHSSNKVEIVALCDVDENNLNRAAQRFPQAKKYRDWRDMLDKESQNIDSVNVSTPDHMHAPAAMTALNLKKHVYCQKPLTHETFESRALTLAAQKAKVVTQMGIQIHSEIVYRTAVKLIQDGAIGKIKTWYSWQGGTPWPHGDRPTDADPVPAHLDWDKWIGVAPMRPYKEKIYHQAHWRGWQDFGCGVLGDFACHILDPVFSALQIKYPTSIRGESAPMNTETWPVWNIIEYEFPGTKYTAGKTIKGFWYDGKRPPDGLVELPDGQNLPGGGSLFLGEDGAMVLPHIGGPQLYPREKFKSYPRPKLGPDDHYHQWVNACLGTGKSTADFDFSGPLTEAVLLGNVAIRFPQKNLAWDAPNLKFTNLADADKFLRRPYRPGWQVKNL
jgi:hypothetical protein